MRICIDAGHGGKDPGAVGPSGLKEAPTVLDICKRLVSILTGMGLTTRQTRPIEEFVELGERYQIANSWDADYFVSIHCNSNGPSAEGIETLYTTTSGRDLAVPIQSALIAATDDRDRGLKERDNLAVLNGTNMPAVLVEVGFISHPETESKLKTSDYKQLLADAIARGLAEFLDIPAIYKPPPPS
jgi:N-acetylmuramoyl-L-alanine amidase